MQIRITADELEFCPDGLSAVRVFKGDSLEVLDVIANQLIQTNRAEQIDNDTAERKPAPKATGKRGTRKRASKS